MIIASRYPAEATSEVDDAITSRGNGLFTKTVNVSLKAYYTDATVILIGDNILPKSRLLNVFKGNDK